MLQSRGSLDELSIEPRVMFDYFAHEVFDNFDDETQKVLLKTAFLPSITPDCATILTQNPRAPQALERLVQDHYFTLKRSTPNSSYELHPLFASFLKQRANTRFTNDTVEQLKDQTAQLLAADDQIDAAVELWR